LLAVVLPARYAKAQNFEIVATTHCGVAAYVALASGRSLPPAFAAAFVLPPPQGSPPRHQC